MSKGDRMGGFFFWNSKREEYFDEGKIAQDRERDSYHNASRETFQLG